MGKLRNNGVSMCNIKIGVHTKKMSDRLDNSKCAVEKKDSSAVGTSRGSAVDLNGVKTSQSQLKGNLN